MNMISFFWLSNHTSLHWQNVLIHIFFSDKESGHVKDGDGMYAI